MEKLKSIVEYHNKEKKNQRNKKYEKGNIKKLGVRINKGEKKINSSLMSLMNNWININRNIIITKKSSKVEKDRLDIEKLKSMLNAS